MSMPAYAQKIGADTGVIKVSNLHPSSGVWAARCPAQSLAEAPPQHGKRKRPPLRFGNGSEQSVRFPSRQALQVGTRVDQVAA